MRFCKYLFVSFLISLLISFSLFAQKQVVLERILVKFNQKNFSEEKLQKFLLKNNSKVDKVRSIPQTGLTVLDVPRGKALAILKQLELMKSNDIETSAVEFAEFDAKIPPGYIPNDPSYTSQWHLPKISAPLAWDNGKGTGVIIAILDSGVDGTHPDLTSRMVAGWNTYNNNSDTRDIHGHGTQVAGSATATGNNTLGVAGVSFESLCMPMVIGGWSTNSDGTKSYYGYASAAASALVWAADRNARVANISYQMSTSSSVLSSAQYFRSKGGLVFISAGNAGASLTDSNQPNVLTISATDSNDSITSWSNRGSIIDLASPGSGIFSTVRGGGYGSVSGTSFAAPVAAGVAALVMSANPSLSPQQVEDILKSSATDLGTAGRDNNYGDGRVNAQDAVLAAIASVGNTPTPTPLPTATYTPTPTPEPDTIAPTGKITSPETGIQVSGANLSVTVSASDNIALSKIDLYVNGVLSSSKSVSGISVITSFRLNTKKWKGSYSIMAKVSDTAKNIGTLQSIQVTK